jgi:DNA-directed RNA polymerase subunit RPC12/RpoP
VGCFAVLRAILRRCASCGSPIGEGYGVTRPVGQHPITCTYCGIRLQ